MLLTTQVSETIPDHEGRSLMEETVKIRVIVCRQEEFFVSFSREDAKNATLEQFRSAAEEAAEESFDTGSSAVVTEIGEVSTKAIVSRGKRSSKIVSEEVSDE